MERHQRSNRGGTEKERKGRSFCGYCHVGTSLRRVRGVYGGGIRGEEEDKKSEGLEARSATKTVGSEVLVGANFATT